MSTTLLKNYMEYRCGIYYWLKNLYLTEPTMEILNEIQHLCKEVDLAKYPEHELSFMTFFKQLSSTELEALQKEIKVEYARLFLGPRRVPVPPYESTYRENKKSIFGQNTKRVQELYEHAGLKLNEKVNIPHDFIGFELEFMYYLTYQTIQAIEKKDDVLIQKLLDYQLHFLAEHLTQWIGQLTEDIFEQTKLDYFKILAKFTNEFIINDHLMLQEVTA